MQEKRATENYLENRVQFQCRIRIEGLKIMIVLAVLIINNIEKSSFYALYVFIILFILLYDNYN